MKLKYKMLLAGIALSAAATQSQAAMLLDTGTPDGSGFPLSLDATDFMASEFHINSNTIIDSISGYLSGGNAGDTFTVALYKDNNGKVGSLLQSTQATFNADGWNSVNALNWNETTGNYWVAFEVGQNDSLSNFNLSLDLSSPNKALATAFNDGSGYKNFSGFDYGVRVSSLDTVATPLPAAAWLFLSAIGGLFGFTRRKV